MDTLRIDRVFYQYNKSENQVLKDLSFSFDEGKSYAIMGPSGSGKSTLLSLLAGLDQPTGGHILLNDTSIGTMNMDLYRQNKVSMIFQAFHLLPLLTVIENVCYPMELKGGKHHQAKGEAKKLLEAVGITKDKWHRFPQKLSGGEQQRVAIARSIASGAKIILADEPTGNLDAENTVMVLQVLESLSKESGYTVIIVTHDDVVCDYVDQVLKMKDGQLHSD